MAAIPATPAGYGEGYNDPVAFPYPGYTFPGFFHNPHGFMAENEPLGQIGDHSVDQVEIRAADGSGRNPYDYVFIILDLGISNVLHLYVLYTFVYQRFQCAVSPLSEIHHYGSFSAPAANMQKQRLPYQRTFRTL
jgi:hypothetical protein